MKKTNVAGVVEELLTPVVSEMGYRLWDVVYRKVGADYTLTVTIDSDAGITIDDCEKVHRRIDPLLDEADPIENAYILEVSSPGIEREIRTEAHMDACRGMAVEVRLFSPLDGKRVLTGTLGGYDKEAVTLREGGNDRRIPRESISQLHTLYKEDGE